MIFEIKKLKLTYALHRFVRLYVLFVINTFLYTQALVFPQQFRCDDNYASSQDSFLFLFQYKFSLSFTHFKFMYESHFRPFTTQLL